MLIRRVIKNQVSDSEKNTKTIILILLGLLIIGSENQKFVKQLFSPQMFNTLKTARE